MNSVFIGSNRAHWGKVHEPQYIICRSSIPNGVRRKGSDFAASTWIVVLKFIDRPNFSAHEPHGTFA